MWRLGLLCAIAGYVDGWGYTEIGRVFAANMTGNTVLFGLALAGADWPRATTYATTLLAFLSGGILAQLLRRVFRRPEIILACAAALLLLAMLQGEAPELVLALLAAAMGLQGAALRRFRGLAISTVVLTSTLLRVGEDLVDRLWQPPPEERATAGQGGLFLGIIAWACYAGGATAMLAGANLLTHWALAAPALLHLALAASLVATKPAGD